MLLFTLRGRGEPLRSWGRNGALPRAGFFSPPKVFAADRPTYLYPEKPPPAPPEREKMRKSSQVASTLLLPLLSLLPYHTSILPYPTYIQPTNAQIFSDTRNTRSIPSSFTRGTLPCLKERHSTKKKLQRGGEGKDKKTIHPSIHPSTHRAATSWRCGVRRIPKPGFDSSTHPHG